jgi:pre-mRNA-processing factor SLU7
VIKGQEAVVRSRYDEDVYPGDHSSVWGSFWADGQWGYACCKSLLENSLCMGNRVEQVAQQQQHSRQTQAAEKAAKEEAGAAELNAESVRTGASDAGV